MMRRCWIINATKRPSFGDICRTINKYKKGRADEDAGYYAPNQNGSAEAARVYENDGGRRNVGVPMSYEDYREQRNELYDDGR